MEDQIVNRVSTSSLVSFDLEGLVTLGERFLFDIKPLLFERLILKEREFRDFVKGHDWSQYAGKHVAITCTADAVVPTWAFMLLSIALQPFATTIVFGSLDDLERQLFHQRLAATDWQKFENAKVVVKGCSKIQVPVSAYVEVVSRLRPIASSIMYGEPCSTVPLFKAKNK